MNRLLRLLNTTIGRKLLVAFSGLLLLAFVLGHVAGNLTIFIGPSALNSYAHWLQESSMLWFVRIGLLTIVAIHFWLGLHVTYENSVARSITYQGQNSTIHWFLNHRMALSGLVILLFIIGHIAHLTLGLGGEDYFYRLDDRGYIDVAARVILGFQNPIIAWSYIAAMGFMAFHLKHSIRALFQTMGFFHENYFSLFEFIAWSITLFIVIGLLSIPLAVQFGLLNESQLPVIFDTLGSMK